MHVEDLRQQISECEEVIGRLQSSQGHALQGYGRWMLELVNVVRQNQRQFSRPPKGPLGASVKLKEQRWSVAIEALLGWNLFSFVVDNREDEFQFNHLVRQWMSRQQGSGRRPPSCICSAFEVNKAFPLSLSTPSLSTVLFIGKDVQHFSTRELFSLITAPVWMSPCVL